MAKQTKTTSSARPKRSSGKKADALDRALSPSVDSSSEEVAGGKAGGKELVIVESPTKAKTINKYLGSGYQVMASVGHVRDLPSRNPKGVKAPVPGVDLEKDFAPSYQVMPDKTKTISQLKSAAKKASSIWFATDLDREGEAIAWHLSQVLQIPAKEAKRVRFNAITKTEIQHAFSNPKPIDEHRVNAQQARRIVDRIVGYQVSPLLWKKVAGGLSAGRVQSVATRLVVEREREIEAFMPDEYWKISGYFSADPTKADALSQAWRSYLETSSPSTSPNQDESDENAPASKTVKQKMAWLAEHRCFKAELVEVAGSEPKLADRQQALALARRLGFALDREQAWQDPKGKGPAKELVIYHGHLDGQRTFAVRNIQTKRTSSRPSAPFITSTLQQAAANLLGFTLQRTMRVAQQLYEGIDLGGSLGQTGLITYMRTDSTHLSGEALSMARSYISQTFGNDYLPEKPNFFSSSNKAAQEAHEAIRPTDATLQPKAIRHSLSDEQYKLYDLIWRRFVSCQMTSAQWDSTSILLSPSDEQAKEIVFKATGRTLVFDGFYKVWGLPNGGDEAMLPPLAQDQTLGCLQIDPTQHFTSPPPRYTEASLQKKLEEEGIGRPSTYAAIISTIQDRQYVQSVAPGDRRLMATDLGKVVTDKLIEAFPEIMDVAYTRQMESRLDQIEEENLDWVRMLHEFYGPFKDRLDRAMTVMTHAKAETQPAPFACGKCGASTVYRFGRKGRFLSCSRYPDCDYAAPVDAMGQPKLPETTDVACPHCGKPMLQRDGRFGPFLSCSGYPECKGILRLDRKKKTLQLPKVPPLLTPEPLVCPKCASALNLRQGKRGPWLGCSKFPKCRGRMAWTQVDPELQKQLLEQLDQHEKANPVPVVKNLAGDVLSDGYIPKLIPATPSAESPASAKP